MIRPTNGRVVWYWPSEAELDESGLMAIVNRNLGQEKRQPLTALIAYVHADDLVNLVVFDHAGVSHPRTAVYLSQYEAPENGRAYCCWMPFQKGQTPAADAVKERLAKLEGAVEGLISRLDDSRTALGGL